VRKIRRNLVTIGNWFQRLKFYGPGNTIRLYRNLKKERCFTLRVYGNAFCIRGKSVDFAVFNSIFALGEYDFEIDFDPEVILDAGANTGASAVYFHHRYRGARIIAIEPEQTNFDLLVKNTAPYQNITCIRGAIYGEDTSLKISDTTVDKYAFRVERATSTDDSVAGFTIDTLMKQYSIAHIDILKMDIEGAEYDVFMHEPGEWLSKTRLLIMEVHELFKPGITELVNSILSSYNFEIIHKGENIFARNKEF